MAQQILNEWSPWMKALASITDDPLGQSGSFNMVDDAAQRRAAAPAPAPVANRIEDDRTAGTRGTTPQSPTTSPIQSSMLQGQTTSLADRIQKPLNPLESRISENQARLRSLGTGEAPQTLGDTLLPGGGTGRAIGRLLINAGAGGVGQARRDEAFKNTLAQRTAAQQAVEADTRQLSSQEEAEARLREQEEMRQRLADEANQTRLNVVGQQQTGATTRTGMNIDSKEGMQQSRLDQQWKEFQSTDQYRRWKEQLDADIKLRVAQMRIQATQNKAPAAMMQTAEFASGGLNRLTSAEAAMQRLEQSGIMGQSWAQNKIEDWIFGKGAVDPNLTPQQRQDIGQLRAALGYTSSAAMRAHTGRTSREIYDDFKSRLGAGQDWSALRGAMNETHDMLYQYATSASDASIAAIRSGTNVNAPAPPNGGPKATHKMVNGRPVPIGSQP